MQEKETGIYSLKYDFKFNVRSKFLQGEQMEYIFTGGEKIKILTILCSKLKKVSPKVYNKIYTKYSTIRPIE